MITVEQTEKIAEMAKLELGGDELLKAQSELCRMAEFAKVVSDVADSAEISERAAQAELRTEDRLHCRVDTQRLAESSMHIKDGFFHVEAGDRK